MTGKKVRSVGREAMLVAGSESEWVDMGLARAASGGAEDDRSRCSSAMVRMKIVGWQRAIWQGIWRD